MLLPIPSSPYAPDTAIETTRGVGIEYRTITDMKVGIQRHLDSRLGTIAERNRCLHEILSVYQDCCEWGWDGYDAEPVSIEACVNAVRLIALLPASFPFPTVSAEPDGHLTLEWYSSPSLIVNVSIAPTMELHYASLIGQQDPISGTLRFNGMFPKEILDLISQMKPI